MYRIPLCSTLSGYNHRKKKRHIDLTKSLEVFHQMSIYKHKTKVLDAYKDERIKLKHSHINIRQKYFDSKGEIKHGNSDDDLVNLYK